MLGSTYVEVFQTIELADYRNAVADIDKAIELKPKHADAYYCRGASYRELGQYGNAVADFDKAIDS